MVRTGHAEFASIAATQDDVLHVARDQEALVAMASLAVLLAAVMVAQAATVYLTKIYQDFY